MLQALLPQVREVGQQVEVWVLDNASTDETAQILEESKGLGSFLIFQQAENVGPTKNIVYGPTKLARGEYVWVLGDHNLLRPNALSEVLQFIESHRSFQAIYANFRCATYPDHWPESACNGYDGSFAYLGNPELTADRVDRWTNLLRPYSAACTQNYAHIVKTNVWSQFWKERSTGPDYSDAVTTYPHTVTILRSVGHLPAAVIRDPVITIFNGAQSWSNPETRFRVYFLGFTGLLKEFAACGLSGSQLKDLKESFFYIEACRLVLDSYRRFGRIRTLQLFLKCSTFNWYSFAVFLRTLPAGFFPEFCGRVSRGYLGMKNHCSLYLLNFRPARWLRSRGWLK